MQWKITALHQEADVLHAAECDAHHNRGANLNVLGACPPPLSLFSRSVDNLADSDTAVSWFLPDLKGPGHQFSRNQRTALLSDREEPRSDGNSKSHHSS